MTAHALSLGVGSAVLLAFLAGESERGRTRERERETHRESLPSGYTDTPTSI